MQFKYSRTNPCSRFVKRSPQLAESKNWENPNKIETNENNQNEYAEKTEMEMERERASEWARGNKWNSNVSKNRKRRNENLC